MSNKPFDHNGLFKHNRAVLELAQTPLNVWGTGEEVGHPIDENTRDDRNALISHFIASGGINVLCQQEDLKEE